MRMQVPSSSRGGSGLPSSSARATAGNGSRTTAHTPEAGASNEMHRHRENRGPTVHHLEVLAVREGQPLPEGYVQVARAPAPPFTPKKRTETVDLSTPPDGDEHVPPEEGEESKRRAADRRNATRSANKQVHALFVKEVKTSLAEGRPPEIKVPEDQTHLKARWHAIAKEAAYKMLDLRKEGWKEYTIFEKEKVHKEIERRMKFDPPIDPRRVDKYLSSHLRSMRAVWKAHWVLHGDNFRHPNCPEEAWEQLIKWWPTERCMEESAAMAGRRSKVQNGSKTGRKLLVDRMEEEVRHCLTRLYSFLVQNRCVDPLECGTRRALWRCIMAMKCGV